MFKYHTVVKDETLSSIAKLYYDDATPALAAKIFKANLGVHGVASTAG
jgi:nucleoid-associated protein YgaU